MKWSDLAVVGRVARAHGIRGQVIVNPESDFAEQRFQPGAEFYIERRGTVESIRVTSVRFQNGRPVLGIDGIQTMTEAETLAGCELRVRVEQLAPLPDGTFYRHDLIGCAVETTVGESVGVVRDVEGTLAGSRLIIDGRRGEVQIPLATEICPTIDVANKRIVIAPPEGLLDLNEGPRRW